jgi:hypothetical protein
MMIRADVRRVVQHRDRRITDASYIRATSFEAAQQYGKNAEIAVVVTVT